MSLAFSITFPPSSKLGLGETAQPLYNKIYDSLIIIHRFDGPIGVGHG
jgi:hypothetical protein